ncbi:dihydroxyacetone kinase operon transcriptional regulator DhaR [Vibrio panuliri]|uniref:dihydroxyacetone kinase operon transcriptional regulator DhaR n=1 Tax=Vibrio panuliri TaxID=1381081 RepID=UPI001248A9FE|nr:dihydroxyacetone kinase operon transcriptional regulator DhaR [Vibrio panuliri]KAB1457103.1 PTS-dependent dihydroxyacetone kinase operon transcriptional regulator DhaR [Vibrio panuliri]
MPHSSVSTLSAEDTKQKWDFFQKHHWVSPEFSLTPVLQSWERCIKQCSPYQWSKPHIASGHTLSSLMKRNQNVVGCATTVIEDTYDLLQGDQLALFVTDDNGCMLHSVGCETILEEMRELGFKNGCFFSEGKFGTNAISLCLATHEPSEVFAAQHFNRHLHPYAAAAAPIFDPFGKLRATVCLLKKSQHYSKESLVIIASCAKEISLQIQLQYEQDSMNRLHSEHSATLECMDDGILAWNSEDLITMTNHQAEQLLNIDGSQVIDKNILSVIRFAPNIMASVDSRDVIRRKQTTVEVNGEFIDAIITLRPLVDGSTLLFVHPIDKIRELAQQQLGGSARYTFDTLPAESRKMKHVISVAKRATKSKSPILITGEEGVGKTDLAMAIHNESENKSGPFIILNCRAINTEQLIQQTLGYDEGRGLPSKFELAHNGTLYLEKIEYLCPELQAVLLKVLKTGLINRSDSQRLIPVKFQLITSTSADMNEYVTQQVFGRQLFYEISANELHIPPLRRRPEDVELMIKALLVSYEKRHNISLTLEKKALETLVNFAWLGNNSELRNKIEKLLLNRNGNLIRLDDIPSDIINGQNRLSADQQGQLLNLEEVEKRAILQAWEVYDGKMQDMAKALNIGRTTLWRKIQKFGLDQPE